MVRHAPLRESMLPLVAGLTLLTVLGVLVVVRPIYFHDALESYVAARFALLAAFVALLAFVGTPRAVMPEPKLRRAQPDDLNPLLTLRALAAYFVLAGHGLVAAVPQ